MCIKAFREPGLTPGLDHYKKGYEHFDKGQYKEALTELLIATEHNPELAEAYNILGATYYAVNNPKAAIINYQKACVLDNLKQKPRFWNNLAITLIVNREFSKAEEILKGLFLSEQDNPLAYPLLISIDIKQGKYHSAERRLYSLLQENTLDTRSMSLVKDISDFTRLAEELKEKICNDEYNDQLHRLLGLWKLAEGDLVSSLFEFDLAYQINADNGLNYLALALYYYCRRWGPLAQEYAEQAVQLAEALPEAEELLRYIKINNDDRFFSDHEIAAFKKVLQNDPFYKNFYEPHFPQEDLSPDRILQ